MILGSTPIASTFLLKYLYREIYINIVIKFYYYLYRGGGAMVARKAHNLETQFESDVRN